MNRFTDRVAVVTGAGSGIGQALAEALAARGCRLALVDVDTEGLSETQQRVTALGREATTHQVDVSDRDQMEGLVTEVRQAHGHVDILVNNAGVTVVSTLEDQSIEDFEWVVGVNLWGVVYGCKLFLPLLRTRDEAYIVNISSLFGLIGVPRQSSYCATKFAVAGFSKSLAVELVDSPVRVLTVHPGGINTRIVKSARYRGDDQGEFRRKAVKFFERKTMPAETAAEKIVVAMTRNSERLLITREAYIGDWVRRLLPALPSRWVDWANRRTR